MQLMQGSGLNQEVSAIMDTDQYHQDGRVCVSWDKPGIAPTAAGKS
jgi:hypothetical protein